MTEKVYPKPTDLGIGSHLVDVSPMPEFEEVDGKKKPVSGTHRHGESAKGFKWWLYSFKDGAGKYTSVFANEKNKAWFDSGKVEIAVLHKEVDGQQQFVLVDEKPVPVLIHFVNQNPADKNKAAPTEAEQAAAGGTPEAKAQVAEQVGEPKITDLPF